MDRVPIDASEILILSCPECQFMTLKVASLDAHLKEHDVKIQVKLNKCKQCGMITNSEKVIEEHVQIWHPSKDVKENVAVVFDETYNQDKPASAGPKSSSQKAASDSQKSQSKSGGLAGLPQINLLQLMHMAHGPVEINLPGSYQLDRTKDGVAGNISFMPSFLAKTIGEQFMDILGKELPWKQLTGKGKDGKDRQEPRLTCYVGPDFGYSGNKFENCNEWNPKLNELKEIVEKAVGREFNAVICYMYRNGRDSLGWHSEQEKELGEHPYIAAVTLGQARYTEFMRKGRDDRYVRLRSAHGDLVITEGAMEDLWVHRVAKDPMARRTSYVFSFRTITPTPVSSPSEKPAAESAAKPQASSAVEVVAEKPAASSPAPEAPAVKAEAAVPTPTGDEAPAAAAAAAAATGGSAARPGSGEKKGKSPGPVGSGKGSKKK